MDIFEPTKEQLLRIRMVSETRGSFMKATGHWPSTIYASAEFIRHFGISGWVGGLEIWGCHIQPIEGQSGDDHRLFCYADVRQPVD